PFRAWNTGFFSSPFLIPADDETATHALRLCPGDLSAPNSSRNPSLRRAKRDSSTAQADVFVPQNHPGRRRRAGTKTEEKGKKKLPGLSPALRSSEAAEDSQEWLSHLPRNEGHDIPAAARNLRYRARTKKAAGLKPGATKLGGGREQPRMAVPPSRFGP